MRNYDLESPLIMIHVPKTGGTSVKKIFEQWFGRKLYFHYIDEKKGKLPRRIRLKSRFSDKYRKGLCIYGHFNKNRGFGIESYYPDVAQFVTIIRDPFELVISEYFYLRRTGSQWKDQSRIPTDDIASYLKRIEPNMLNHFPFTLTLTNYIELLENHFIHLGITEDMNRSMAIIASKLGVNTPGEIAVANTTSRSQEIPYELKEDFRKRFPVEFAVYDYAKRLTMS